jgi:hypothetical protein
MNGRRASRRELLVASAAAGAALGLQRTAAARPVPGVTYADDETSHFAFLEVSGRGGVAGLDLTLVREDGATPYRTRFEQPLRRRS